MCFKGRLMKVGIYTGTFDPFNLCHENITRRASILVDQLIILVIDSKTPALYSLQDREVMIERTLEDLPNIIVNNYQGVIADFISSVAEAEPSDEFFFISSIKDAIDYQIKLHTSHINKDLSLFNNDTIFLAQDPGLSHISTTMLRELLNVEDESCFRFVPQNVWDIIEWRREHPSTPLLSKRTKETTGD